MTIWSRRPPKQKNRTTLPLAPADDPRDVHYREFICTVCRKSMFHPDCEHAIGHEIIFDWGDNEEESNGR